MEFIRENKKLSIIALVILTVFVIISVTLCGYVYNVVHNYILETKAFYFNSSVLSINNKNHKINNWDGINSYVLTIDLNNRKNDYVHTTADISYNTYVECSDNVVCTLSANTGVLYEEALTDSYQITVRPADGKVLTEDDLITVDTYVESTSPYKKKLSATYVIGIEKSNFSYDIDDSVNSNHLVLNLTNSLTYYEVEKAFNGYTVGQKLSIEQYNSLTEAEKLNCYSAKVTLTFDPSKIYLDMSSDVFQNKSFSVLNVDGYDYVSSFSFNIDATSSERIVFYKKNIGENYTYPIVNSDSIIDVSATLAE